MLASLSIKNYALIDNLRVDFSDGFSIITGETGAGKSILLGGLSLVLGKRADLGLVYDKSKKCIVEGRFDVRDHGLEPFFLEADLDYDDEMILRRELLPSGKSRAFVNDTPVNLATLSALAGQVIDIHSQHETLQLAEADFQFKIVDSLAGNSELLKTYSEKLSLYQKSIRELQFLVDRKDAFSKAYEYNKYMFDELSEADLTDGEELELEERHDVLTNSEEIKTSISQVVELFERESFGLSESLSSVRSTLSRIASYSESYRLLSGRWESFCIEAQDILSELESMNDELIHDPEELQQVDDRLNLLQGLMNKHQVRNISELIEAQEKYEDLLSQTDGISDQIEMKKGQLDLMEKELRQVADKLSASRRAALPKFTSSVEEILGHLEMKNTRIQIELDKGDDFLPNGMDRLEFKLSSDRGRTFESMGRIASGGEMSRIMLAVKCLMSEWSNMPAIIFDEIDSGVSGEISNRMADLMLDMSSNMQVISITHLPQVAAKGARHYLVYKEDDGDRIQTRIRALDQDERLVHLAEMLGGTDISDSALAHARQLLKTQ